MNMRLCCTLVALFLASCSISVAQESTVSARESAREFYRETIREKIRFDLNRLDVIPTVGEIRDAHRREMLDEKGAVLAGSDLLVSDDARPESEVHAAVNPTDSANIVVSPIRSTSGGLTCPIYYTKDFGQSWHKSNFLNLPPQSNAQVIGGGDPVFAFDEDGHLYFTWINLYITGNNDSTYAAIFWADSDDGGETWEFDASRTVVIDGVNAGAPFGIYQLPRFSDKQWMAVDRTDGPHRNRLYIAYVELQVLTGVGQIVLRRLLPESDNVIDISIPVSNNSFTTVQFASLDVDYKSNVHVTFFGFRQGTGWGLWHSVSSNGGESFSDPTLVSKVRTGQERFGGQNSEVITGIANDRLYPCPHIGIDNSESEHKGNLYAVWTALGVDNNEGKGFDIYFSRFENYNNPEITGSWAEPIIVNDDGLNGDQFYPSITVSSEGVVVVTWYDKRDAGNSHQTHYYMAYSFDGGKTFTKNIQVTSQATDFRTIGRSNGDFGIGEYTQVLATSGYAIPVWADGRSGDGNMDIYAGFFPITPVPSSVPDRVASVETGLNVGEVSPNPVVGESTSLNVQLQRAAVLSVEVVDVNGKRVQSIITEKPFASGSHQIAIPVGALLPGTYFCRLQTERGSAVRKMIVE